MGKGIEEIKEQMKTLAEESSALHQKIEGGFMEIKEELGSMVRFSLSDLEKKIQALEARIKALEKMIFR